MPDCVGINLGGTVTDAGITGGVELDGNQYAIMDWSNLWGTIAIRGQHLRIGGRAGRVLVGSRLPDWRLLTLNLRSKLRNASGGFDPNGEEDGDTCSQVIANLIGLTGFFGDNFPLVVEWVLPDGNSLYVEGWTLQSGPVIANGRYRELSQPLEASYPYWRQAVLETDVIAGADTITNPGTAGVYDAELVFAGDGNFINSTTGQALTVSGSGGPVTVRSWEHTVAEGGIDADGVLAADGSEWMRFEPGVNTVTSTVSVAVNWRPGYK